MTGSFPSERGVDLIIALVALEALLILAWRAFSGRGPAPWPFISNLLAGAFLLLALRNALAGAAGVWIAACLVGALIAHLADLRWRWTGAASDVPPPSAVN